MPMSIDPPPGDNEFECARCGAYIYHDLTRCPNCGVNLYEPENDLEGDQRLPPASSRPSPGGLLTRLRDLFQRISGKPYRAEDVFGDGLDQAVLYNDLLRTVGGDSAAAERLIEAERRLAPQATRKVWLQRAIQHSENNPLS